MYFRKCGFEFERSSGLVRELAHVVQRLWSDDDDPVDAQNLLRELRLSNKLFEGFLQHDMHEALLTLLEACAETSRLIKDAFVGELRSTLICGNCRKKTFKVDETIGLSIGVDGFSSIDSALAAHFAVEQLGEGNEWKCDHCKVLWFSSCVFYAVDDSSIQGRVSENDKTVGVGANSRSFGSAFETISWRRKADAQSFLSCKGFQGKWLKNVSSFN